MRLLKLEEKEAKIIDEEFVVSLCCTLEGLYISDDEGECKQQALNILIQLAVCLLKSPNRLNRLKGLNMIMLMAGDGKRESNPILWKNVQELAKKLIEYQIIQILFGEDAHEEIINKSQGILFLLVDNDALTDESLKSIWDCCCGKQESVAKSALGMLKILLNELSIAVSSKIYNKFD